MLGRCIPVKMSSDIYIQKVLSNLPNSIYWKDREGVYLGANAQAAHMVGFTSINEIIGKTDFDFASRDKAEKFRKNDMLVMTTGKEICVEEQSFSQDGKKLIQLSTKKPITNDKGDIIGIMGVTVDITELKKKEKKLIEQKKSLKKALTVKSELLRNINHEMRTHITSIVNISDILVESWHSYSEKERYENMKIAAYSGKRLLSLMKNILDLSKIESGKMSMQLANSSLGKLIDDIFKEAKLLYLRDKKNITLEKGIQPNLDTDCIMDADRIYQVLRNLIDNAIKFTESGAIKICLTKQNNNLKVTVQDEGLGIPEDETDTIFDPFIQSTRTKTGAGGTGLGLAICKEIIRIHNGSIWAESNNKGTSVHFLLPKNL